MPCRSVSRPGPTSSATRIKNHAWSTKCAPVTRASSFIRSSTKSAPCSRRNPDGTCSPSPMKPPPHNVPLSPRGRSLRSTDFGPLTFRARISPRPAPSGSTPGAFFPPVPPRTGSPTVAWAHRIRRSKKLFSTASPRGAPPLRTTSACTPAGWPPYTPLFKLLPRAVLAAALSCSDSPTPTHSKFYLNSAPVWNFFRGPIRQTCPGWLPFSSRRKSPVSSASSRATPCSAHPIYPPFTAWRPNTESRSLPMTPSGRFSTSMFFRMSTSSPLA